ncbi:hypothetical protein F5I97DRAFT_1810990 [Phlebopus sp. FC_14]|nr:hypothetical protein F5I97DRAFT_1810990 [Phlebopus sp. FC_14]
MQSPTKAALSLVPHLLLSSSLPGSVPTSTPASTTVPNTMSNFTPNPKAPPHTLISTRDPLSLPIMTSNFRRFVARVGPVFWLQDRIEEVILWKKGWRRTVVWLTAYAFLCYFPRMILLIPHILLLGVMLAYYPNPGAQSVPLNVGEGTVDWQANIQAIQNLMGAFSDVHDAIFPLLPLLLDASTHPTFTATPRPSRRRFSLPYTRCLPSIHVTLIPSKLGSLVFLSPRHVQNILTHTLTPAQIKTTLRRIIDNDRLSDYAWAAPMCTVELWENERWIEDAKSGGGTSSRTWSKLNLRPSERAPWTRGRDGWSGVGGEVSSNLTFSLAPGWAFVETEGWRPDLEGRWVYENEGVEGTDGWTYSTDTWSQPRSSARPGDGWVTRRRRWVRRVYWEGDSRT